MTLFLSPSLEQRFEQVDANRDGLIVHISRKRPLYLTEEEASVDRETSQTVDKYDTLNKEGRKAWRQERDQERKINTLVKNFAVQKAKSLIDQHLSTVDQRYIILNVPVILTDLTKILFGWIFKQSYLAFDMEAEDIFPRQIAKMEIVKKIKVRHYRTSVSDLQSHVGNVIALNGDAEHCYWFDQDLLSQELEYWTREACWENFCAVIHQCELIPLPKELVDICLDYLNFPEARDLGQEEEDLEKDDE